MKVTILSGGKGTRLMPLTVNTPKPLVPVHGRSILEHIVQFFEKYGCTEIGLMTAADITHHFDEWRNKRSGPAKIEIFGEAVRSGTFGCMRSVKDWVGDEQFIVTNGDCLLDFDLNVLTKKALTANTV